MNVRRILLWGLPFVVGGLLIYFANVSLAIENQEQAFEVRRQKGWNIYLQGSGRTEISGPGPRNDVLIDEAGWLWVARGGGVYVFDGSQWTSHEGAYSDLAISPQGEIWAVEQPNAQAAVHVYDGQQWKSYPFSDLGGDDAGNQIQQFEIDSRGRIWVTIGQDQLAEIVPVGDKFTPRFYHPELSCGWIVSLDADKQGRIWAGVWGPSSDDCAGLYIIDGETLKRVPSQGVNLRDVVSTVFDDQGRAYVATYCGSVMMYDGENWTSIPKGDNTNCDNSEERLFGITLDNQGRVWAWANKWVKVLEQGKWITLTYDNSFLPDPKQIHSILFVAVDRQDQVWIGTDEDVRMIAIEDARPLPENVVQEHQLLLSSKEKMSGSNWFLPITLAILWLAAYLNMWPGVLLALVVGLSVTYLIGGGPEPGSLKILHPGVFITFAGMTGGLVGDWLDKIRLKHNGSQTHLNLILAITGLAIGFVLWIPYVIVRLP